MPELISEHSNINILLSVNMLKVVPSFGNSPFGTLGTVRELRYVDAVIDACCQSQTTVPCLSCLGVQLYPQPVFSGESLDPCTVRKHQRFIAVGVSLQFNNKSPQRWKDCFLLFSGRRSLLRAKYWSCESAFIWPVLRESLNSKEYLQKGGKTRNVKLCCFIHIQTKHYSWPFHLC